VKEVERNWLEPRNATSKTTTTSTPAGRLLFEYIEGTWKRAGGNLDAIMKELSPFVVKSIMKSDVENASKFEATSLQQSGLHVDGSTSNSIVSHTANMLGTTFPVQNAENGSETPRYSSGTPSGTEAFHNSIAQSKDDHQYISLLWAHAARAGATPQCENTLDPALWSCRVTFDGTSAEAQGRTSKDAKHEASRKLCNHLGLN
jgi:hypothetical protein